MVENILARFPADRVSSSVNEVKDMACYQKVLANPDDDISFSRIAARREGESAHDP